MHNNTLSNIEPVSLFRPVKLIVNLRSMDKATSFFCEAATEIGLGVAD